MKVTRDIGRDIGRESRTPARTDPARPCPALTGPTARRPRVETSIHFVTYVSARPATGHSPTESHIGMMPLREGWAA